MFHFKITNIKLTLKTDVICLDSVEKLLLQKKTLNEEKVSVKRYQNFLVIKNKFTYVLFKTSKNEMNHFNVTNVSTFADIDFACDHILKSLLGALNVKEIFRRIDNISATLNLNIKINLSNLISYFETKCNISFNSEKFPGAFLKFKFGTAIVFHTGKCVFIGCKKIKHLECLERHIQTYVNTKTKL